MRKNQHTLKKSYYFEGKGLHTGTYAHMKIMPAPADSGIKFRRTDLRNKPVIEAIANNVTNTARSTTISHRETLAVTIEHIMSCFTGLGVDNAIVELDNIEVPIMDGSARYFVEAIMADGLQNQGVPRHFLEIKDAIELSDDYSGSWIRVEPASAPSVDVTVDFGSRIIGIQNVHWDPSVDYATEIGPSRTFCFFHEIEHLYRNNLIKVVITRKDGSTFFEKVFSKAMFESFLDEEYMRHNVLLGMVYNGRDENNLRFLGSVGRPDILTEEFVPFNVYVSRMGEVRVEKANLENLDGYKVFEEVQIKDEV